MDVKVRRVFGPIYTWDEHGLFRLLGPWAHYSAVICPSSSCCLSPAASCPGFRGRPLPTSPPSTSSSGDAVALANPSRFTAASSFAGRFKGRPSSRLASSPSTAGKDFSPTLQGSSMAQKAAGAPSSGTPFYERISLTAALGTPWPCTAACG